MRAKRSAMLVALVVGLVAIPAVAGDLSGTWTLTSTTPRGERTSTMVLAQSGEKLTVTLKGERGESTGTGTLKGDAVEWTVVRQTPMGEMTMTYTGKVTGDTMAGEVQMMDRAMAWKAVREGAAQAPAAAAPAGPPAVAPAPRPMTPPAPGAAAPIPPARVPPPVATPATTWWPSRHPMVTQS